MLELEQRHRDQLRQNQELTSILARLRSEADILREVLLAHNGCSCTKVHAYIREGGPKLAAASLLGGITMTATAGVGGRPPTPPLILPHTYDGLVPTVDYGGLDEAVYNMVAPAPPGPAVPGMPLTPPLSARSLEGSSASMVDVATTTPV